MHRAQVLGTRISGDGGRGFLGGLQDYVLGFLWVEGMYEGGGEFPVSCFDRSEGGFVNGLVVFMYTLLVSADLLHGFEWAGE